jgi:hypothetical protein
MFFYNNNILICFLALSFLLLGMACQKSHMKPENTSTAWKKIKIDLQKTDENGLNGPADGKVSITYEYCIPAQKKYWRAVKKIDPSAQKMPGSRGRVGCDAEQWLIMGNTHQKNHRYILFQLASLPYVKRIEEVFWE